jgi:uncharacterized SAM-binding protein YcdF (DUF218 family)
LLYKQIQNYFKMRKSKILLFVFAILVGLLSACNFKSVVNSMYAQYIVRAPYDVIIVPGMGFDTATQQTSGFNTRIVWAKTLYDRGVAKNIIFSGAACYSPYIEGKVMKMIAEKIGVPPQNIYCETQAQHGKENVYYSWLMAHKLGFKKIALATDAYQALYLKAFVEKNMPDMGILPVAIDSLKYFSTPVPAIDASTAMVKDFIPLTKRQSAWSRFEQANSMHLPALPKE